jgi:hypothetical protein
MLVTQAHQESSWNIFIHDIRRFLAGEAELCTTRITAGEGEPGSRAKDRVLLAFEPDALPVRRRRRNHTIRLDFIQDVHLTWSTKERRVVVAGVFL